MKTISKLFLSLLFLQTFSGAVEVGNLFSVDVQEGKRVEIVSRKMVYYMVRFRNEQGVESGPVIVERNDAKVKVNLPEMNMSVEGGVVKIGYDRPERLFEFHTKTTIIDRPEDYMKGWKDSTIEFRGGNLLDWENSSLPVFLLNLTVFPQLMADASAASVKVGDGKIARRLVSLADTFGNIGKYLDELNYYYSYISAMDEIAFSVMDALREEGEALPEYIVEIHAYNQYIRTLIENMARFNGIEVALDPKVTDAIKQSTKEELAKIVLKDFDESVSKQYDAKDPSIDAYIEAYTNLAFGVESDDKKVAKVVDTLLAAMERGLARYEQAKVDRVKDDEEKRKLLNKLRTAKLVVAAAAFVNRAFLTDEIAKDDSFIMKFFAEVGGELYGLVTEAYVTDPAKFISKYSESVSDKFYSKASKTAVKVGKGFYLGVVAGNKLLPFLADFGLAPNRTHVNLVDGRAALYGKTQKRVVLKDSTGKIIETFDEPDEYTVKTERNETVTVELYVKQKDLFGTDVSPWKINNYIPPSDYLHAQIFYGDDNLYLRGCLVKSWNTSIAYYGHSGVRLGQPLFSFKYLTGNEANDIDKWRCTKLENFIDQASAKYTPETIRDKYRLQSYDQPIMRKKISITDEKKILYVDATGYENKESRIEPFKIRFVFETDTTPPVITLPGENPMTLNVGDTFVDPGAEAFDDVDGNLSGKIAVSGSVDTLHEGNYTLVYTVSDSAGNRAQATRVVEVTEAAVDDTTPPVITLPGENPMTLNVGDTFVDPGAEAFDDVDGNLSDRIRVDGGVDTSVAGRYTIVYTVSDRAGNEANATRTVDVVAPYASKLDNKVIAWKDEVASHYVDGKTYTHRFVLALYGDATCRLIALNLDIDEQNDDKNQTGGDTNQIVTSDPALTVIRECEWESDESELRLVVTDDATELTAPLNNGEVDGNASWPLISDDPSRCFVERVYDVAEIGQGEIAGYAIVTFDENGHVYGWRFGSDGALGIYADGNETAQFSGDYAVGDTSIIVTDGNGSTVLSADNRAYRTGDYLDFSYLKGYIADIEKLSAAPTILLNGDNPMTLNVGDTFVDPGAEAFDDVDGNLTAAIVTSGTVETSVAGNYTITYSVTDSEGNEASVQRRVDVVSTDDGGKTILTINQAGESVEVDLSTVKTIRCGTLQPGDTFTVNGEIYTVVDNDTIRQIDKESGDFVHLCTSLVTDMSKMFWYVEAFDQPIGHWDVSNVKNMSLMFQGTPFNQPIGDWDVSSVDNMHGMFWSASAFNQPIGGWNVTNVTDMGYMFYKAGTFNQPIGKWDTSNVTNMSKMFGLASAFNQPIGDWNISKVADMSGMFAGADLFNQPIGEWDVSNVTNMNELFYWSSAFNQLIEEWNVSNVTDMDRMFYNAQSFSNNDLSGWSVENVVTHDEFMVGAGEGNIEPRWVR